jgi:hypothetical protein
MTEKLYRYAWGNNPVRAKLKDRICRALAFGKRNTVLVEFTDNGERQVTSRRALRKLEAVSCKH